MKKTVTIVFSFLIFFNQPNYSQNLVKGDFKVTIAYLENILNKGYTKRQIDSILPYNSNRGWNINKINAYNPITKDWTGKTSYKYYYSCSYRKQSIEISFSADNDSSAIGHLTIIIDGYYWLDEWITPGNNFKPNGYKVDIYKLIVQELVNESYTAGESEVSSLGRDNKGVGTIEYYHKPNCKVKLFQNLSKPIISLTLIKTN